MRITCTLHNDLGEGEPKNHKYITLHINKAIHVIQVNVPLQLNCVFIIQYHVFL